jgi:broad specificity phosphatase PhoE
MQLIIIRHAQSANNVLHEGEKVISRAEFEKSRSEDPLLSALGERQIKELSDGIENALLRIVSPKVRDSRKLKSGPYAPRVHMAVSPMKRALCTAVPVIESMKTLVDQGKVSLSGIEVVPFIFEIGGCYKEKNGSFAGFPGMNSKQVREVIPEAITHDSMESGWWSSPSRETEEELELRVTRTLEWIRHSAWKGECDVLVMVSHQDFVCACLRRLLQTSSISWLYNTSLTSLTLDPIVSPDLDPEAVDKSSDGALSGIHHCKVTVDWINAVDHLSQENIS